MRFVLHLALMSFQPGYVLIAIRVVLGGLLVVAFCHGYFF